MMRKSCLPGVISLPFSVIEEEKPQLSELFFPISALPHQFRGSEKEKFDGD